MIGVFDFLCDLNSYTQHVFTQEEPVNGTTVKAIQDYRFTPMSQRVVSVTPPSAQGRRRCFEQRGGAGSKITKKQHFCRTQLRWLGGSILKSL